jgi:hypothetical protein
MKRLLILTSLVLSGMVAFGQGFLSFGNRNTAAGIDAKVYGVDGVTALDGAAFKAQLYWGASADSLTGVGPVLDFRTGAAAGYIVSTVVTIAGAPEGAAGFVAMRAWASAAGTNWEAAQASGAGYGSSDALAITLGVSPNTPPNMTGLTSFALVPEPSTIALGLLGLGVLALRRRK